LPIGARPAAAQAPRGNRRRRRGRTLRPCPGTSSAAAPAATPSRSTDRCATPAPPRPALAGTTTRWSCSRPWHSPGAAVTAGHTVATGPHPPLVGAAAAAVAAADKLFEIKRSTRRPAGLTRSTTPGPTLSSLRQP